MTQDDVFIVGRRTALAKFIYNNPILNYAFMSIEHALALFGLLRLECSGQVRYRCNSFSVKLHMRLKGKTPAEVAGIKIEGENPRLTVIRNAKSLQRKFER